jgi:hypothetical protein
MVVLAGLMLDAWAIAAGVAVLGWVGHRLWRSVVIEVSPDGLARGLRLDGAFVGSTASMAWSSVAAIETDWWAPDDHRALETSVRSRDGTTIRISTAMGLQAYRACLAEIIRRAPGAVHSSLTDAALVNGPPARRGMRTTIGTAGVLALVLGALVGFGYVLAQGRSSLARYLEEEAPLASPRDECRPGARLGDGPPPIPCQPLP